MSKKLTLGCDPEVFLFDEARNSVIPACGIIGGTKNEPKDIGEGVGVQEDNVAVEFNIHPVTFEPGGNALALATQKALEHVQGYVRNINNNYDLHVASSHIFTADALASEAAQRFGCDPDLDAYSMGDPNPTFTALEVGTLRMAGGHIHLGLPEGIDIPKWAFVQLLDALVTFRWQVNVSGEVIGARRRQFYGKPGAYRDKPYGLEYRTPSNYWLNNSDFALDISNLAWWIVNNEAATKNIYDMINFKKIKEYYDSKLSPDSLETLSNRIADIWENSLKLPESKEQKIDTDTIQIEAARGPIRRNPLTTRSFTINGVNTFTLQDAARQLAQRNAAQAGQGLANPVWIDQNGIRLP